MAIDLDKPASFAAVDPANVLSRIVEQPEQYRVSWDRAEAFPLPRTYRFAKRVIFLGMGGSAVGADYTRVLMQQGSRVGGEVVRDYDLPSYVNERTLVVACSYSGATEETLSATRQAIDAGAKILGVTSGGTLGALADQHHFPAFPIDYPSEPRSAFAHTFTPLLVFMQRLGFMSDLSEQFIEATAIAAQVRDRVAPDVPEKDNPAKQLARALHGRMPVVLGGGFLGVVATRWKTQLNENSKVWAVAESFPELNHNLVVGLPGPKGISKVASIVLLHSSHLHARTTLRYEITRGFFEDAGIPHQTVEGRGSSQLAHMLSLTILGDFVSYYLAMLNGVDPQSIDNIVSLKDKLAGAPA